MSFGQFRSIDLLIFSFIAVIFEIINRFASVSLPSFNLIFMSFTIVLTLIAMYRWGIRGVIVSLIGKLVGIAVSTHNNNYQFYISYVFGTMLGVLIGYLIFQKLIGKKRIKKIYLLLPYLIFDFLVSITLISLIFALLNISTFSNSFINNIKSLLVQECMSIFTSSIILLIANRKGGKILVEMRDYVKEVQDSKKLGGLKELKESPKFNSDRPFTEYDQFDESSILDGGTMDVDQLKELEKLYQESDKINITDPIDCLVKQEKDKNNV